MTFGLRQGSAPLLVSIPHRGTQIPAALRGSCVARAAQVQPVVRAMVEAALQACRRLHA